VSALNRLYAEHGEEVQFFVVYLREAHAADSRWPDRRTNVKEPTTLDERLDVAETCAVRLAIELPMLIDGMDDAVGRAYDSWPDRIFLIGRDGRIAYKGGHGPWGFSPRELAAAIEALPAPAEDDDEGDAQRRYF